MYGKKLRLLLFQECNKNCERCCNKDWDLDSLKKETLFTGYDEIILTGGEPMLKPLFVINTALMIREKTLAKIYMYTAKADKILDVLAVLHYIDGITLALHEQSDVVDFMRLDALLLKCEINKSFRLNVFKGINISNINTSIWNVKSDIEWIKNCPLPVNEVFRKI